MVSLKYAKEYRLDTFTDESGKVKDCTVYIGPLYEWEMERKEMKRLRITLSLLTLVQIVLFISSLWHYNDLSRLWWVVVPYCCLLFVFLYQTTVCYHLFTVKGQMHREKKEKTVERLKGCSVMGTLLTGTSLIAATISIALGMVAFGWWDVWFVLAEGVLILLFVYEIQLSKVLRVRELVNPKAEEWKNK